MPSERRATMSVVALTLVLGPANSAKAGEVLGAYAAAAPRGALLVVPTALDADHYARELAAEGTPLHTVLTFSGLAGEIARRAGYGTRRVTELQRRRLLRRALAGVSFERLAGAAAAPGFLAAAGALISELQGSLIAPPRFAAALRTWAAGDPGREAYARQLAAIYFAYRGELERLGRVDGELYAWQALDALRAAPARWGQTPVYFYGFDDLDRLQRDAVETLAGPAGAEVIVSLTSEGGRVALAARAETVQELQPLAERTLAMPAVDDYYAAPAREALHHLERHLFEPGAGRMAAGEAVALLESGGERAEAELVAAEILALAGRGVPAEEIAVVLRSPAAGAGALTRVFEQYGIEFALERRVPLAHTALGRSLLALARCALGEQASTPVGELLAYCRAPGVLADEGAADALEARLLRRGARTVAQARTQLDPAVLARLDALATAEDPSGALADEARLLLAGRGGGRAPALAGPAEQEPRACAAILRALAELAEIEPRAPRGEVIELLEQVEVPLGAPVRAGAVLVADPLSIRARRFRVVIVCGLQEGEFPRPGRPEPFLADEMRRELAMAAGLRLRLREDALARERYLFYACVSRASERVVLSYRSSDEEGNLALPSPFLRDVAELLDEGWWERRRRRLLADVVWAVDDAPTERERRRALAAGAAPGAGEQAPPRRRLSAVALAHVRHREIVSAGALESYADCPVKWLVDRQLEPEALEPTAEPLARGSFMHDTLERVLRELGDAVTPDNLPRALELLHEAVRELPPDLAAGQPPGVRAAAQRAIEADLRRYLEHEAAHGAAWRPLTLEQRFGFDEAEGSLPALELVDTGGGGGGGGGASVRVRGAIDRIDVDPTGRRALVRDYKSGSVRQDYAAARWASERRLQVPLYMLAVRELLGLEPVAGLYQPLRGAELRPRGAFAAGSEPGGEPYPGDEQEPEALAAMLDEARARAVELAARLRAGEIEPCPATCSRDGCRYPGICRST